MVTADQTAADRIPPRGTSPDLDRAQAAPPQAALLQPEPPQPAQPQPAQPQRRQVASLRLRPLRLDDEAAFLAAHRQMAEDGFNFGLFLGPDMAWTEYLRLLRDHQAGVNLSQRLVPSTFLVADVAGQIVGRVSIRHRLNEFLVRYGGHIGFGVLRSHRRRGYATEILRQSLIIARAIGIDRVLVTCDDDNVGSMTVIEACGGQLEDVTEADPGAPAIRRYWID
ncbi:MAG TPA: GNAT family N-acetyltransferase [Streptosporangiaceae bacterium]|nr:GNAT family N-acetyltransferase [Streptosporangiaceae bacterium]